MQYWLCWMNTVIKNNSNHFYLKSTIYLNSRYARVWTIGKPPMVPSWDSPVFKLIQKHKQQNLFRQFCLFWFITMLDNRFICDQLYNKKNFFLLIKSSELVLVFLADVLKRDGGVKNKQAVHYKRFVTVRIWDSAKFLFSWSWWTF